MSRQFGNRGRGYNNRNRNDRGGRRGSSPYRQNRDSRDSNYQSYQPSGVTDICRYFLDGKCTNPKCYRPHLISKIGSTRHQSSVKDVVMWEKAQQLFTCTSDSVLKLWNCSDWSEVATLPVGQEGSKAKNDGISAIVLEGSWLFVGYDCACPQIANINVGCIRAWNLENTSAAPYDFMESEMMPFAHTRSTMALTVATDPAGNATLFSGSGDGTIRYWQFDPQTNMFKLGGTIYAHIRGVTRLKTIVQGNMHILISASMDSTIKIWDLSTFKCIKILSKADDGHSECVTDIDIWQYQNEFYLISGGLDKNVVVWKLAAPFAKVYKEEQDDKVTSLCAIQDTSQTDVLLIGTQSGSMYIKLLPSFEYKSYISTGGHRDAIRRIISGPSHTFFSVSGDKMMIAWQWQDSVNNISR